MAGSRAPNSGTRGFFPAPDFVGSAGAPAGTETDKLQKVVLYLIAAFGFAGLLAALVGAITARAAKTRRNKQASRQLAPRVAFLRDLRQLMPPPMPAAAAAMTTTTTVSVDIRAVLAGQLDACVKEADSIVRVCTPSCCLRRFFRSNHHAGKLDVASKNMDHAYGHILPIVSQVDTAQRLLHLLELQIIVQDGQKNSATTTASSPPSPVARSEETDMSERQAVPEATVRT